MDHSVYLSLLRLDFRSFLLRSFYELNPSKELIDNIYIDLMIEYLEQVNNNKINRLIINLPPRSLKSIIVSIAWPAWLLGINPRLKIIVVSYSRELSVKLSEDTRIIMQSEWYRNIFPGTIISKYHNRNNKFITTEKGFRLATSTNSALTGEGADLIIIDDPLNAVDARSNHKLDKVNEWFNQSLISRLNDRNNGKIILVMQRLHNNDLSGFLLEHNNNWTHLKLPLIAKEKMIYSLNNSEVIIDKNQLLNPQIYNDEVIKDLKQELGEYVFNSQYQQEPLIKTGQILEESYLKYYKSLPHKSEFIVLSLDSANKEKDNNDYSAFTIWQVSDDCVYLLYANKKRLNFPNLKLYFTELVNRFKVNLAIIEDKASGSSLIQEVNNLGIKIVPYQTRLNKIARLDLSLISFMQHKVFFPEQAPWLNEYLEELLYFPNHKYDDFVDSTTQFICYWQSNYKKTIKIHNI